MAQWESWVERQIREATERGEFDNLPGTGKPLDLGSPDDPDWWIKRLMQREGIDSSQALHPTLALRREAKTYPAALADIRDEEQVREVVRDFNRRVIEDRLRPVRGAAMPPVAPRLDVEEMVAAWRALRALRAAAGGSSVPAARTSSGAAEGTPSAPTKTGASPDKNLHHLARTRWWQRLFGDQNRD